MPSSTVHVASVHWLATVHTSTSIRHVTHATSGRTSPGHHVPVGGGSSSTSAKAAPVWEAPEGGRWQSASRRPAEVSTGTRHWEKTEFLLKHFRRTWYSRPSCRFIYLYSTGYRNRSPGGGHGPDPINLMKPQRRCRNAQTVSTHWTPQTRTNPI